MMAVLEAEVRKSSTNLLIEESAAAFRSMSAYSGVYSLEGDKWVTKVDVSLPSYPAWHGTNQGAFLQAGWRPVACHIRLAAELENWVAR